MHAWQRAVGLCGTKASLGQKFDASQNGSMFQTATSCATWAPVISTVERQKARFQPARTTQPSCCPRSYGTDRLYPAVESRASQPSCRKGLLCPQAPPSPRWYRRPDTGKSENLLAGFCRRRSSRIAFAGGQFVVSRWRRTQASSSRRSAEERKRGDHRHSWKSFQPSRQAIKMRIRGLGV